MKFFLLLLFLVSCGPVKERVVLLNGKNGHSIVTTQQDASSTECLSSGRRIDIFVDINDSLLADEGDVYQSSLVICNGMDGIQGLQGVSGEPGPQGIQGEIGPQGLQGERGEIGPQGTTGEQGPQGVAGINSTATITITSSGCNVITGTVYYSKNDRIYDNSSCSSSHSGEVANLDGGNSFWVADNKLAVDFTSSSIKIITFN